MIKTKVNSSPVLQELKIIKTEIRRLRKDDDFTALRIKALQGKIEDESALIQNQNLEFKDEILGEIQAMRDELTVTLGQYSRHEDTLEDHEDRLKKLEKPLITP